MPGPRARVKEHPVAGRPRPKAERYYLPRIPAAAVQPCAATQTDNVRESRWWTLAEMSGTRQTIHPAGPGTLAPQAVLADGPPEEPVTLA